MNSRALHKDLVGAGEQGGRNGEAERFGGLRVDHEFEFNGQFDWEVAGLHALENLSTKTAARRNWFKKFTP